MARILQYIPALLLLGITSAQAQIYRGIWAAENPALAAGESMTWDSGRPLVADPDAATLLQLREEMPPANMLAILYEWMPAAEFQARQPELLQLYTAHKLLLPTAETPEAINTATDPKRFLDNVIFIRPTRERVTYAGTTPTTEYRMTTPTYPPTNSLVTAGKAKGYLSFTTNPVPPDLHPPEGQVIVWVEFELLGGLFSVRNKEVWLPAAYTPVLRLIL